MACDICGAKGTRLNDLRTIYQTDEVKVICNDCEKVVNNQLGKLQTVVFNIQTSWLKRFVNMLHAKATGETE